MLFVILNNRIDQKQITVAKNIFFALKKCVLRNYSPDLPVSTNIIRQISVVQHYEQEKITRMIVILKKRRTRFSHHTY